LGLVAPFVGAAAGVHEDNACRGFGTDGGHLWIPGEAAYVVDDFCSGLERDMGGGGFVGVNGEDGVRALAKNAFDYGEKAGLLFLSGDGWRLRGAACLRTGAGAFSAEIEKICTFVEELERVSYGGIGREELAAVAEGVGSNVDDAHYESAWAE